MTSMSLVHLRQEVNLLWVLTKKDIYIIYRIEFYENLLQIHFGYK